MESPATSGKPASSLPTYLSEKNQSSNSNRQNKNERERRKLYESISASGARSRVPVDYNLPLAESTGKSLATDDSAPFPMELIENKSPRDPRDSVVPLSPPATSRSASPYTQNPTVDFDGLSWPSKYLARNVQHVATNSCLQVREQEQGLMLPLKKRQHDSRSFKMQSVQC